MLPCDLWKRFSAPLLTLLLVGCNDTAAEPLEPSATESKPALVAAAGAEPKGDVEKAERDLQAVLEAIEDAEKKLATLRRQASDLRRTIAARRGPGKT